MKTKTHLVLSLLFTGFFAAPASEACNFCMLGQGISPSLIAKTQGLTLDVNYVESDKQYAKSTEIPGGGKKESWLTYTLTGFFPLTDDFTLSVALPYTSKTNVDLDDASGLNTGSLTTGLGDISLTGRYTLLSFHTPESTFTTTLLGGIKLPTGTTNNRDASGNPVDRHALPGTGSIDYRLGASTAYTLPSGFQFTADAVYSLSGSGSWAEREHRFGDSFNFGVKGFYRVAKNEASGKSLFTLLGVSGEWTGNETGADLNSVYEPTAKNLSTGGTVLFADLGIYASLGTAATLQCTFSKAFYHYMNFDADYESDPAENYKVGLSLTAFL